MELASDRAAVKYKQKECLHCKFGQTDNSVKFIILLIQDMKYISEKDKWWGD